MNIILIGLSGSGKSTIGKEWAGIDGYAFLDTDDLISVHRDDEHFLAMEEAALLSVPADTVRTIIATGGSAVLSEKGMAYLSSLGRVYYLKIPIEDARINDRVVCADRLAERLPLYEKYADKILENLV